MVNDPRLVGRVRLYVWSALVEASVCLEYAFNENSLEGDIDGAHLTT